MTSKRRLFAPLPPGVDNRDPQIINWRLDNIEQTVQDISDSKMDLPHFEGSWLKAVAVWSMAFIGLTGLVSPEQLATLLSVFGSGR